MQIPRFTVYKYTKYTVCKFVTAGAFLAVWVFWHYGFQLISLPVFLTGTLFGAIAIVDFDTMTIPDGFVIALIPLAIAFMLLFPAIGLPERMLGFFCISAPMLLLAMLIPGSFGGGDIKLIAVCGFMLGWQYTLLAMFIALMMSGVIAAYLLLRKKVKRGAHIPFGPYLCAGCFLVLLYGDSILSWYLGTF